MMTATGRKWNPLTAWLCGGLLWLALLFSTASASAEAVDLQQLFTNPPAEASPWVFWYWMYGCYSRQGITADLEAMQHNGIGGAYLMPIKGPREPHLIEPPIVQLSPEWWAMVKHAMQEADRLGLKLAMHACDGFAVAGGPWITPGLSMQKLVGTIKQVDANDAATIELPQPETNEGYYRDIAVLAFPALPGAGVNSFTARAKASTSEKDFDAQFLVEGEAGKRIRLDEPGWIQFQFDEPFLCRAITVTPDGNSFQAQRLKVEVSDDGEHFRSVGRLTPPRHGWQNGNSVATHAIEPVEARYFRFVYDPAGSEPGSEGLDFAKWRASLKLQQIVLHGEPRIHQYRGKTGEVWRLGRRTTEEQVPEQDCVPLAKVLDLSDKLDSQGHLDWQPPAGRWTIVRIGHTSTGSRNATGGGGQGLECDKLSTAAAELQFDRWFGEARRQVGPELASRVLKIFHVDSWECGSQNWTADFREEFTKRRGYDLLPYLPCVLGIPVQSAADSERFLHDLRQTIVQLSNERFFGTLARLAHEAGCQFSAECVAPTMLSDGMRHFAEVDIPMGEFWLRSPTHDKPNDIRDAISAAHVYGKPIVQAEAFTQLRMAWDESPSKLKTLGDLHYCLGINRFVYHVFTHSPWLDRRPGMTLDNIGLLMQRDQTWWEPARAWIDYHKRCQALLQVGRPVVDIGVFTGEELPRRSVLPERLTTSLPALFHAEQLAAERRRLANEGLPLRQEPRGVTHSANLTDSNDWPDPLQGLAYDSVNRDALLRLASVREGRIVFPGGAEYQLLVLPSARPMAPDAKRFSPEVLAKLQELADAGATILFCDPPLQLERQPDELVREVGKGRFLFGPYNEPLSLKYPLSPDVEFDTPAPNHFTWTHRHAEDCDIYFLSNQTDEHQTLEASFRMAGKVPEIWNPVTGEHFAARSCHTDQGRTNLTLAFEPQGSLFVVFRQEATHANRSQNENGLHFQEAKTLSSPWQVAFDSSLGGPEQPVAFDELKSWSEREQDAIRYYSGTASYTQNFKFESKPNGRCWLDLGDVAEIASVRLNGKDCGVAWTPPYRVEITDALKPGNNELEIAVTNTWRNRRLGDQRSDSETKITWTTASPLPDDTQLLPSGLFGPVKILSQEGTTSE